MLSNKSKKLIHTVYAIAISLLLLILAILLTASCIELNSRGNDAFTPQSVSEAFSRIAPFVYVTLLAVVGGFVLHIILPIETKKQRSEPNISASIERLSAKVGNNFPPELAKRAGKEKKLRFAVKATVFAVYLICGLAVMLAYLLNSDNFSALDPNGEVADGAIAVAISLALPLALSVAAVFVNSASRRRQLEIVKQAMRETAALPPSPAEPKKCKLCAFLEKNETLAVWSVRGIILIVGGLFLLLGILNGGAADVVAKAIKICMECIGLG